MAPTRLEYRCLVSGLSSSTTAQSLETAFRRFGQITEAKVTSPGSGYVTFSTENAMNAAVNGMRGHNLNGSKITVDGGTFTIEALTVGSGGGGNRITRIN